MLPIPARLRWSSRATPIGTSGAAQQPAFGLGRVPVRAQQVRAEVPHDGVLLVGPDHLQDAQGEPDGVGRGGAQHAAGP